jgi:hypothetical protein
MAATLTTRNPEEIEALLQVVGNIAESVRQALAAGLTVEVASDPEYEDVPRDEPGPARDRFLAGITYTIRITGGRPRG